TSQPGRGGSAMRAVRLRCSPGLLLILTGALAAGLFAPAAARAAEEGGSRVWGLKVGFSYLATSGNADQSTLGFEGSGNRSWGRWSIEGSGSALNARKRQRRAAES